MSARDITGRGDDMGKDIRMGRGILLQIRDAELSEPPFESYEGITWPDVDDFFDEMFVSSGNMPELTHEVGEDGRHYFLHEDGSINAIMGDEMYQWVKKMAEEEDDMSSEASQRAAEFVKKYPGYRFGDEDDLAEIIDEEMKPLMDAAIRMKACLEMIMTADVRKMEQYPPTASAKMPEFYRALDIALIAAGRAGL